MTPDMVDRSDLVIAMAREHLREAVLLSPASFPQTFTLKELVRRGRELGPRSSGEPVADWLARMHDGRVLTTYLGQSRDDDVADPMGQRMGVYVRTADEISSLIEELSEMLWAELPAVDPEGRGVLG